MSKPVTHNCPNCNCLEVSLMDKKESEHLDQGILYKVIQYNYVCNKNCWHNWTEYERVVLNNFNIDANLKVKYLRKDEIISPQDIAVDTLGSNN